jgi:archaemetzincin
MNVLQLVPVGDCEPRTLERLGPRLSERLGVPWDLAEAKVDITFALHAERQQYHSTEILERMRPLQRPESWRLLGVTDCDLYIPILTFVFGEAEMAGRVAIVSTHRLHQEFYGLPADDSLFGDRLLKEAMHELGHTLDLRHCTDYRCAMAASHAVEWIDLKEAALCAACRERIEVPAAPRKRLWPF